ncbi:MAG: hypothetical protein HC767_15065 [Akkermansiaceae bacterium]|nr:hypothetical protein [Akkermansiaceae bacterium]
MPNTGAPEDATAESRPDENGIDRFAAGSSSSSRALRLPDGASGAAVEAGCWPNSGAESPGTMVATGAAVEVGAGWAVGAWPPNVKLRAELEAAGAAVLGAALPSAGNREVGCAG